MITIEVGTRCAICIIQNLRKYDFMQNQQKNCVDKYWFRKTKKYCSKLGRQASKIEEHYKN